MLFVFKCLNGLASPYLAELITIKENSCNYQLRSDSCLQESKTANKFSDRAFTVCGPVLWNRLPDCMKETNSLDKFKKELKTHLFAEAFGYSLSIHFSIVCSSPDMSLVSGTEFLMLHSCVLLIYEHFFLYISSIFAKCYWILYRSWHLK